MSEVSAARDTPAPRRLSVDRSVTVKAVAPDAPADGVAVAVAAADNKAGDDARGDEGVVDPEASVVSPVPLTVDAAEEGGGGADWLADAKAEPMVALMAKSDALDVNDTLMLPLALPLADALMAGDGINELLAFALTLVLTLLLSIPLPLTLVLALKLAVAANVAETEPDADC